MTVIYYRKYGNTEWIDITNYIDSDTLPSGSDPEFNSLYQFNISFFDPKDPDDNFILMANGDDIVICETSERINVLDDIKAGCIFELTKTPKGIDNSGNNPRFYMQYDLTIEQRDFSLYPFKISPFSFDDQSMYQNISTVLDLIFDSENIRNDLGGSLLNGIVIPKYELLSPDLEIEIPEKIEGTARDLINDLLNQISYKWSIVYYVEPHPTNTLNLIQKVNIWQD